MERMLYGFICRKLSNLHNITIKISIKYKKYSMFSDGEFSYTVIMNK